MMKQMLKRTLAVLLTALLVAGAAPAAIASAPGTVGRLNKGELCLFGTYPQTHVTDASLISQLDLLAQTMGYTVTVNGLPIRRDKSMKMRLSTVICMPRRTVICRTRHTGSVANRLSGAF